MLSWKELTEKVNEYSLLGEKVNGNGEEELNDRREVLLNELVVGSMAYIHSLSEKLLRGSVSVETFHGTINVSLANFSHSLELEDVVQEGALALLSALRNGKYHIRKAGNNAYSTFAKPTIVLGALYKVKKNYLSMVKAPIRKINELIKKPIAGEELLDEEEQTEEDNFLRNALRGKYIELNTLYGDDSQRRPFSETIADEQALNAFDFVSSQQVSEYLTGALDTLPERERKIVEMRAGLNGYRNGKNLGLRPVGKAVGLSQERVRQLEERARGKIRRHLVIHKKVEELSELI